eukprot:CAMPEP_0115718480 /NCGR_PEP_ID=MMETSP0272-20121206/77448_1 /TAXON_ID=71861 /ORGANISM="Scrippsiella trochoidea, Strain CCMP3099" /LENGTH=114 /DNA_ID=CAMNT_0003161001 /DNA_START=429 /DNA_END=770 /DNA_ORIENTATION=+
MPGRLSAVSCTTSSQVGPCTSRTHAASGFSAATVTQCSSSLKTGGSIGIVRMGSGMSNPFDPEGEGAMSGGVRGREGSEEFVEVSQPPDEQRDDMSPSRPSASRDELREDLPEE